ncbi:NAD(P)/FAD-dependent oxidoreductase [Sediminibacterium ginsengisoli]|uniref:Glycine/D-amino acid oxidase n=1 Tax=Sediminibacterium ginsengisoli TaxID=413434 RepID=A0A1T4Q278_9BACT|nr:FAD-dependent oxidoreductase [Sediminibacterium ginsengisoli]SJZ97611.1 Glycine/D-amino acid oxidase [Sediminibacterium ginsengisoli]
MDLRSGSPYWLLKSGILHHYPSLQRNTRADIAVIGCGISGALAAYRLCQAGYSVIMLDKRHVAMGSTAASTSLLQYEIDTPLHELAAKVGLENALTSYRLCIEAIEGLGKLANSMNDNAGFSYRESFQFASYRKHVPDLRKELELRQKHRISSVEWLDAGDVKKQFGFEAPAGILSADGAEMDAYYFTHELIRLCREMGAEVFDNTTVTTLQHHKKGVTLITEDNARVECSYLVIACGYESEKYVPRKIQKNHSTYALVSEPVEKQYLWHRNALIWETAVPYTYLRTTPDNRILIGGRDDDFYNADRRNKAIKMKRKRLELIFARMFPGIPFKTDYAWAGTFCSTKDGLPYIGSIPERPRTYFALGFGGNGITFSYLAADIIAALIKKQQHEHAAVFSFNR